MQLHELINILSAEDDGPDREVFVALAKPGPETLTVWYRLVEVGVNGSAQIGVNEAGRYDLGFELVVAEVDVPSDDTQGSEKPAGWATPTQ
jgi:hypothetical protein